MNAAEHATKTLCCTTFATELGWFCLLGRPAASVGKSPIVQGLVIGHATQQSAAVQGRKLAEVHGWTDGTADPVEEDWYPSLRRRLCDYAAGLPVDFQDVELAERQLTEFQQDVLQQTRQLAYGQTMTYGELASQAGRPRAARAVGSVMAGNTVPVLVPCHRVVANGGRFGGFSAPQGPELKKQMLHLEAAGTSSLTEPLTETVSV